MSANHPLHFPSSWIIHAFCDISITYHCRITIHCVCRKQLCCVLFCIIFTAKQFVTIKYVSAECPNSVIMEWRLPPCWHGNTSFWPLPGLQNNRSQQSNGISMDFSWLCRQYNVTNGTWHEINCQWNRTVLPWPRNGTAAPPGDHWFPCIHYFRDNVR